MGKKKTKVKVKTQRVTPYSPEQRALLSSLTRVAQERLTTGAPAPAYPGRIVPEWLPEETRYVQALGDYAERVRALSEDLLSQREPLTRAAEQTLPEKEALRARLEAALAPLASERERIWQAAQSLDTSRFEEVPYETGTEVVERYFKEAIETPLMRYFQKQLLPKIRAAYAGPGYWSSFRARAEQQAIENIASKLAEERAKLTWQEELARRQALERALARGLEAEGLRTRLLQAAFATTPRLSEAQARLAQYATLAPEETYQAGVRTLAEALRERARSTAAAIEAAAQAPEALGTAAQFRRAVLSQILQEGLQRWLMGEPVGGRYVWAHSPDVRAALNLALGLLQYPEYTVIAGGTPVVRSGGFGGFLGGLATGMAAPIGSAIGGGIAKGLGKVFGKIF